MRMEYIKKVEPPVWPWRKGKQAQMLHLDLWVDTLEEGAASAIQCGAREAKQQFFSSCRTMLDPTGHPFWMVAEPK